MIKLLFLFFTFTLLHGTTTAYLLPDENALFETHLMDQLKQNSNIITLTTPKMKYSALKKILLKKASNHTLVTLIVSDPSDDPAQLIAYRGVELHLYTSRALNGSSIVIDQHFGCSFSTALDQSILINTTQIVVCSDDLETISRLTNGIKKLKKRSKPYLTDVTHFSSKARKVIGKNVPTPP